MLLISISYFSLLEDIVLLLLLMLFLIYIVCNSRYNSLLLYQGWFTYLQITTVSWKKSYGTILAHSRFCSACTLKVSGCSKAQAL